MRIANATDLANVTGVRNPRQVSRAPNRFYVYPFAFTAIAAAAGSSATTAVKNEAGGVFVVDGIVGACWHNAAVAAAALVGASRIGTPLAESADISLAATGGMQNNFNPLTLVRVDWQTDDQALFQSTLRWVNVIGSVKQPHLPWFNPVIPPGSNMRWTIYNDTGVAIDAEICLLGHMLGV